MCSRYNGMSWHTVACAASPANAGGFAGMVEASLVRHPQLETTALEQRINDTAPKPATLWVSVQQYHGVLSGRWTCNSHVQGDARLDLHRPVLDVRFRDRKRIALHHRRDQRKQAHRPATQHHEIRRSDRAIPTPVRRAVTTARVRVASARASCSVRVRGPDLRLSRYARRTHYVRRRSGYSSQYRAIDLHPVRDARICPNRAQSACGGAR